MRCILNRQKNIYFHLAAEEYLLKQCDEDVCMIWESDHAVVVGKHQNAMAEVNYLYTIDNEIPVARRLSGGGTVYHGPGNINFTFIRNGEKGKLVDFKRFVSPVIAYLNRCGIAATIGKRNDILAGGLKISGNAEHVYRTRVLHHGTLLFDADLENLRKSIDVDHGKYNGRAVQSVRSEVVNIASLLDQPVDRNAFMASLFKFLKESFSGSYEDGFTVEEKSSIGELSRERYAKPEWIFGYSPRYEVKKNAVYEGIRLNISLHVEKGVIDTCRIISEPDASFGKQLSQILPGVAYDLNSCATRLKQIPEMKQSAMILARTLF